jgi:hypothetical protein
MLEFAERVLKEVRKLEQDTSAIVVSGRVSDMEQYRFLMGRLEGIRLVDTLIRQEFNKHTDD